MESLNWRPEKGEAMSTRFAILFVIFLGYVLTSGIVSKQGSGFDPLGSTNSPISPATLDTGGGLDPNG